MKQKILQNNILSSTFWNQNYLEIPLPVQKLKQPNGARMGVSNNLVCKGVGLMHGELITDRAILSSLESSESTKS